MCGSFLQNIIIQLCIIASVFNTSFLSNYKTVDGDSITRIVHAGGAINGEVGSNSLEALDLAYSNGDRAIELDFNFTSDNQLVCIHDWSNMYLPGINENLPLNIYQFPNAKIFGKYTSLTSKRLMTWLADKPDVYIVTDVKDDNIKALTAISEYYSDMMDRFIVQIYSEDEYDKAVALGFEKIIYTLYRQSYNYKMDTDNICKFVSERDILAVTFSTEIATPEYVSAIKKSGKRVFVHTVNDPQEIQNYIDMGVDGVYSDY